MAAMFMRASPVSEPEPGDAASRYWEVVSGAGLDGVRDVRVVHARLRMRHDKPWKTLSEDRYVTNESRLSA